jgi:hypothetical protein
MRNLILAALVLAAACTERPYRLPYADGVEATITADHTDHKNPEEKMFDIRATQPSQVLAAAKAGWVREISDTGDSTSTINNYVWIEHPLDYCQPPDGFVPARRSPAIAAPARAGSANATNGHSTCIWSRTACRASPT